MKNEEFIENKVNVNPDSIGKPVNGYKIKKEDYQ
jgi:hypothetical protein